MEYIILFVILLVLILMLAIIAPWLKQYHERFQESANNWGGSPNNSKNAEQELEQCTQKVSKLEQDVTTKANTIAQIKQNVQKACQDSESSQMKELQNRTKNAEDNINETIKEKKEVERKLEEAVKKQQELEAKYSSVEPTVMKATQCCDQEKQHKETCIREKASIEEKRAILDRQVGQLQSQVTILTQQNEVLKANVMNMSAALAKYQQSQTV